MAKKSKSQSQNLTQLAPPIYCQPRAGLNTACTLKTETASISEFR